MTVKSERGYLIPAIDSEETDYLACAVQLAKSIRQWHPDADISVLTVKQCNDPVFNNVIPLPYGDLGGFANDWQCFHASPYRQTIKLEADMIASSPIDHWWTLFELRDVVISQGCRTFYNKPGESRFYRQLFDRNELPDVYNAITYWRLSVCAQEFFNLVKNIFENWDTWKTLLKFPDNEATTDVVYAIAAKVIGPELVTLPQGLGPNIVHMKKHVVPIIGNNWTEELVWEDTAPGLRIQTVAQHGFVHYHNKEWRVNEPRNN